MRKQILAIMIAAAMVCLIAPLVGANDKITITVTPSGGNAAIDVNQSAWNGGIATINGAEVLTGTGSYNWANLTSTGNVPVDVKVKVNHSADWVDGSVAAHNTFVLNFYTDVTPHNINTTGVVFKNGLAYNGYQLFDLGLQLPSSTSTTGQQVIVVTFTATPAA